MYPKPLWYRSQANPLQEIKKVLHQYTSQYHNEEFFLFGSRARWDADIRSDYDIGIQTKNKKPVSLTTITRLQSELNELPRNIDLVDFTKASEQFQKIARKNIIYI
jgi:predicted nucleotidyltransferase